jgi:MoaA/NifB/PqqE/SkfB family radical SAM enzyme
VGAEVTLHVLYRGPLESCNYSCDYCPFAKRRDTRATLDRDRLALERFVSWIERYPEPVQVFFTPWGEALIRRSYREVMVALSRLPHLERVAIQTNLSAPLDFLDRADVSRVAFWATYHPSEVDRARFVASVREVVRRGPRISVGMVGLDGHLHEARALRSELPPEVYLWVNAAKRVHGPYGDLERALWSAIDPYFEINTLAHVSLGERCRAGYDAIAVDGEGEVRRCHFTDRSLGNLYDGTFALDAAPAPCEEARCGCHIGYVHLEKLGLRSLFEGGVLERIPRHRLPVAG